jgi:hypothetical protein
MGRHGPSDHGCRQVTGAGDGEFRFLFGYADGPRAGVRVALDCGPAIDNGLFQAGLDDPARARVLRLAPPSP